MQIQSRLRGKLERHYMFVKQERLYYQAKTKLAQDHPKRYLSLIIDGMDQNKYMHTSIRLSRLTIS
jgi:hypothetical protein